MPGAALPDSTMNLFRLIILGFLGWLVFRVVRSWANDALPGQRRPRTPAEFEMMARCLRCKTFVPRDSLSEHGRCRNCEKNA